MRIVAKNMLRLMDLLGCLSHYYTTNWKLILFSSTNYPTGTIYSEDDIRILDEFANRNNILLLCDQEGLLWRRGYEI